MKFTHTGRVLIYDKTRLYHGDQYTCTGCKASIVFTNSKECGWPGALAQLKETALDRKAQGLNPNFPIEVQSDEKLWQLGLEAISIHRNLDALDEKQLLQILYETVQDQAVIKMSDKFTEAEIVHLLEHPQFEDFSEEFRERIWVSVNEIFSRVLNGDI